MGGGGGGGGGGCAYYGSERQKRLFRSLWHYLLSELDDSSSYNRSKPGWHSGGIHAEGTTGSEFGSDSATYLFAFLSSDKIAKICLLTKTQKDMCFSVFVF